MNSEIKMIGLLCIFACTDKDDVRYHCEILRDEQLPRLTFAISYVKELILSVTYFTQNRLQLYRLYISLVMEGALKAAAN